MGRIFSSTIGDGAMEPIKKFTGTVDFLGEERSPLSRRQETALAELTRGVDVPTAERHRKKAVMEQAKFTHPV